MTVTIEEASAQLAQLIEKATSGEEIVISRDGAPSIRLTPLEIAEEESIQTPLQPRVPGIDEGKIWISPDFDGPMPDDWLDEFYNGEIFPCEGS